MSVIREGVLTLVQNGLIQIIIFALVFAIVFGVLRNVHLFAKSKEDNDKVKPIHTIIALVMGVLTILPHYVSRGSPYDIVPIVQQAFPQISLVAIALIGVMVLLGIFGLKIGGGKDGNIFRPIIFIVLIGIVIWIFGGTVNFWNIPYWLTPDIIAMIVAIIVFGVVVSFVMGPTKKKDKEKELWNQFKDIIEEKNKKK